MSNKETPEIDYYLVDADTRDRIRALADRLCGGSDKERDAGNLLVVLLDQFVPDTYKE